MFDVLQEAGLLNLKYACEDGLCGACKVKVLFGEITAPGLCADSSGEKSAKRNDCMRIQGSRRKFQTDPGYLTLTVNYWIE